MPTRQRAHFINSLSGFKSANLIGTQDVNGQTNLAIFSSVVHLGASPALVGFIMRPDNNDRHTLDNISISKQYTINQVSTAFYEKAHQTSARYPREKSEFEEVGLSTFHLDSVNAPFVKESRLKYAVTLKEILPIPLNNTLFIIGEITDVICDEETIKDDGYIDIQSLQTVSISGLDSYHISERLSRLSYAKPNMNPHEINDKLK
ncbi:flavin reductase family protein [Psychromonas sp. L1A2]|uniref:flavin reductase family protein n=1 Tax=Psychromonas sp. L1A2 TaxID=2686356 RepID=UPI00135AC3D3|nr:flavin reductase [Psychromonas sp. L1A2]